MGAADDEDLRPERRHRLGGGLGGKAAVEDRFFGFDVESAQLVHGSGRRTLSWVEPALSFGGRINPRAPRWVWLVSSVSCIT